MIFLFKMIMVLIFFVFTSCASNQSQTLSDQQIESKCQKKKLEASKPITNLSLATGSEGPKYQIGIKMSSDFIAGRDPDEVYRQCKISLGWNHRLH